MEQRWTRTFFSGAENDAGVIRTLAGGPDYDALPNTRLKIVSTCLW
jgi:hypothetical protein